MRIIQCAKANQQISYAFEIPPFLAKLFDDTVGYLDTTKDAWKEFVEYMLQFNSPQDTYGYPGIQARLQKHGIDFAYPSKCAEKGL